MRIDLARPDALATRRTRELAHRDPAADLPTVTWSAWSCTVRLVVSDETVLDEATDDVMTVMARVDSAASRFRNDSDLSWANLNPGRPIAVSRLLIELLDGALTGAQASNGALDPTIGSQLRRAGYDRDIMLVPQESDQPVLPALPIAANFTDIQVDREMGLLTVPLGAALDLGATAKAQTADLAAAMINKRYGCNVLVEIGGDLAVAGTKSDWQVTVAERAGNPGQQVTVSRGGVATSTTTVRRWQRGGTELHHIIDPRTGQPAKGPWRTVTVAADSALLANSCSTAAIVLGPDALPWLRTQPVAARLIAQNGQVTTTGGWPC
jgi:thiamine biosynthesis lipoprotein